MTDETTKMKNLSPQVWLWVRRCVLLLLIIIGGLFLRRPLLLENSAGLLLPVFAAFLCFLAVPWIRERVFGATHWGLTAVFMPVMLLCSARAAREWNDAMYVAALPRWVDMLLLSGLYVVVARGFFFLLERASEVIALRRARPALVEPVEAGPLSFWAPFGTTLATLVLFWLYVYYPYGSSPDAAYQLDMLQATLRLNDIHTPAHTIFLSILLGIVHRLSFVVVVQILMVSFLSGLFGHYLAQRWRAPLRWMVLLCVVFGLGTYNYVYMYPWKDTPYAFCVGIVTFFLLRTRDADFTPGIGKGLALGAALAFCYLFRYNGIILAVGCGILFLVWAFRKKRFRFLISMALAVVISVVGVNLYAYQIMGMERWENGFSLQVFASGIAAVVVGNGNITEVELEQVDALMGVDWVRGHYVSGDAKRLIWDAYDEDPEGFFLDASHAVYNNQMVVKLGGHTQEVVALYLRLLPKNLRLMVTDIAYNTQVIWGLQDFFCHAFLVMLLILAMLACWTKQAFRSRWVVFLPVLLNTLSIFAATITNEERYLLPTYVLFAPLLLYVLATGDKGEQCVKATME